ncbi:hypothetical protein H072_9825 [Dactylellina haptotyla CBS 200.50]|uniref:Uncharacterized protein n=1 Tax=Dactylellina haptotyla (strain CBS 200.50) TaxID=1284197 RepID=S8BN02_DACHA|nr:hypothetical protein H072_9825 [Dactylellina haptotyla CBS 200.50]
MEEKSVYNPQHEDAQGEKASGTSTPDYATIYTPSTKSENPDSGPKEYLPCCLRFQDALESSLNHASILYTDREHFLQQIIKIMETQDGSLTEPRPLIFLVDESRNITLQPADDYLLTESTVMEYEPHFWLPESCIFEVPEKEKTFRRIFFAVGCLVYQIFKGEKPWAEFSGLQAQRMYEGGYYPRDAKSLPYTRIMLSYWSWEFVVEMTKRQAAKQKAKKISGIVKNFAIGTAIAGGIVVTGALLVPLILPAIGFGTAGVTAGTMAAGWQSAIGLVEAGSLFAILQSAGAGGAAGAAAITAVALGGAGTAAGAGAVGAIAGSIESSEITDEELFFLFLRVVRKKQESNLEGEPKQ